MTTKKIYKYSIWEKSFQVDLPHNEKTGQLFFEVTLPDGSKTIERGFWLGDKKWCIRYRPDVSGKFLWRSWGEPGNAAWNKSGNFEVVDVAKNHGPMHR